MAGLLRGVKLSGGGYKALTVALFGCLAVGVAFAAQSAADDPHATATLLACTGSDEPANFPVYSAGASVDGNSVTSVSRRCDDPPPSGETRANYVSYLYGTCEALADGTATSCAPPLEVQTWPACERSLADYELVPGTPYPHEALGQLQGVPAYSFDDGTRVELYTGTSTIVIFSANPALIDDAVTAIQREPSDQPPGDPVDEADSSLAEPADGAMAGDLSCA